MSTLMVQETANGSEEDALHQAWQESEGKSAYPLQDLDSGRRYWIVYAGLHSSQGPDFKNAILECQDGDRVYGDVEIHVHEADFFHHQHHSDSNFDDTKVHLFAHPSRRHAVTSNGNTPQRLVLDRTPTTGRVAKPNWQFNPSPQKLAKLGHKRFMDRASGFELAIAKDGINQTIYSAVAQCLGYSANRDGFLRLAYRLGWDTLQTWMKRNGEPLPALLWAAGLGPNTGEPLGLAGPRPVWNTRVGRPVNAPRHRIRGLAELSKRFFLQNGGPIDYISRAQANSNPEKLCAMFTVEAKDGQAAFIGPQRANAIVVNAVLPALYAWGKLRQDSDLMRSAYTHYSNYPPLGDDRLLREAKRIASKTAPITINNAKEQQGLYSWYQMVITSSNVERQLRMV